MSAKDKEIGKHHSDLSDADDLEEQQTSDDTLGNSTANVVELPTVPLSERDALIAEMHKALEGEVGSPSPERLELIRSRIESGYYQGELERAELVARMMKDLLGKDPF